MRMHAVRIAATLLLLAPFARANHQQQNEKDPTLVRAQEMLRQARTEIGEFEKAGGKKDDPSYPIAKWVAQLWELRDQHPGTSAAKLAGSEAVHLLVHAERFADAYALADRVPPNDLTWEPLAGYLLEAAANQKDYSSAQRKLAALLKQQTDAKLRAAVQYHLGRAQWKGGDVAAAKASFAAVVEQAPDSHFAKEAEKALHELMNLGYGQPAPAFTAKTREGAALSLADYRGRVALIVFWAST
jgi:hypothetical protein